MNKQLVSLTTALAIAAAGGFAYAGGSSKAAADASGAPGVEVNVGSNAAKDGGLPGVEASIGADGDQKNIASSSAPDTSTLGAGPATSDTSSGDLTQPRVDRN
jgi:hypothetical protein